MCACARVRVCVRVGVPSRGVPAQARASETKTEKVVRTTHARSNAARTLRGAAASSCLRSLRREAVRSRESKKSLRMSETVSECARARANGSESESEERERRARGQRRGGECTKPSECTKGKRK
eukprot:5987446-Pleurochrysis_carterae.AAC.3